MFCTSKDEGYSSATLTGSAVNCTVRGEFAEEGVRREERGMREERGERGEERGERNERGERREE